MKRLRGGIPRGLGNHRSRTAIAYRRYCVAMLARHGPLPDDALRWLKEAALIALALDQLQVEAEAAQRVLVNGAGRRARDKARVTIRQLERRAARLRASLHAAEERIERLAGHNGQPQDLASRLAKHHREAGGV
jgi:hypothetical protein